jgi:hypothetical protein
MGTSSAPAHGAAGPDLDRWLEDPQVRTRHSREARAGVEGLWREAMGVALGDCRLLGRVVSRRLGIEDPSMTFAELFGAAPFVLLEQGPGWTLSGLCGRIWSVRGELGRVDGPDAFHGWDEAGTVRVLFAHWAAPRASGATLHSEVRVSPVDRRAALRLTALEPFIAAFQSLIGREALALAVRRAEAD